MARRPGLGSTLRQQQQQEETPGEQDDGQEGSNPPTPPPPPPEEQDPPTPPPPPQEEQDPPPPPPPPPPPEEDEDPPTPPPPTEEIVTPVEENPVPARQEAPKMTPTFVGVFTSGEDPCYQTYGLMKDGTLYGVIAVEHDGWLNLVNEKLASSNDVSQVIRDNAPFEMIDTASLPRKERDAAYFIIMRTGSSKSFDAESAARSMGYNPGSGGVERVAGGTWIRFGKA